MDPVRPHWSAGDILAEFEGATVFARNETGGFEPIPAVLDLPEPAGSPYSELVATKASYATHGVQGFGICQADQPAAVQAFLDALATPGIPVRATLRRDLDSTWRRVRGCVLDLRHQEDVGVVLVGFRDLGPCAAPEQQTRHRRVTDDDDLEGLDDAHFETPNWFLFELDDLGIVTHADGDLEGILGLDESRIVGREVLQFVHPEDHVAALEMWAGLMADSTGSCTIRQRVLNSDGTHRWVDSTVLTRLDTAGAASTAPNAAEDTSRTVLILSHDATRRRRREQELHRGAMSDPLTGLPNRFALETHLGELLLVGSATVAFVDLNGFKEVNDELGHLVGDEVLATIARRLGASVARRDGHNGAVAGRWGGDEFVLIGPDMCDDLLRAAIDEAFAEPVVVGSSVWHPRCSYGIAHGTDASDPDALVRSADTAMYGVKPRRVP